ncbi:MAG: cyclic nucleotide-binding domain-containing protein [Candidatus Glassbacteria bacterium]|nr:cyclic nucleotide-binding domain-containing protein [Candidatus Glassbacteria bacterium]
MDNIVLLACFTGFISAVSLPIGSAIGLTTRPGARITSALMAFGGGALLFALTIEIVAHSFELAGFWPLAIGCVIGGLLYELLNHGLNSMGAFFRKTATVLQQTAKWRAQRAEVILRKLLGVPLLQTLDPEKIAELVPHVDELDLEENIVVFRAGTRADAFYLIESGTVEIILEGKTVAVLGPGDVFGEIGLMADRPRTATAATTEKCRLYRIVREDFDILVADYPEVKKVLKTLMDERSRDLVRKSFVGRKEVRAWKKKAAYYLKSRDIKPTSLEMKKAIQHHGPATLGIWLGILLDGIPESIVIGISVTLDKGLPLPLVAGVFLSNLPEAMSSSLLMRDHDYSKNKNPADVVFDHADDRAGRCCGQHVFPEPVAGADRRAAGYGRRGHVDHDRRNHAPGSLRARRGDCRPFHAGRVPGRLICEIPVSIDRA